MTLQEIRTRLQKIEELKFDDETAHGLKDELYKDFINFIAFSTVTFEEAKILSKEVMKAENIELNRWCA